MVRFLAVLTILLITLPARAEPAARTETAPAPAPAPRYLDYRPYLWATDGAALALLIGSAALNDGASEAVAVTGVGAYAVGPAIIHAAHGQPLRSAASVGMRVGFPLAGAALGVGIVAATCDPNASHSVDGAGEPESDWHCLGAAIGLGGLGFISGVVTAIIVDDGTLGKVKLDSPPSRAQGSGTRIGLAPFVAPRGKGMGLAVAGAF